MALADATAISFMTPVVTLILAVLILKERVGPVRWSAVAIMLIGALILLRPGTGAFQPAALIALGAALFSAVEATFIKKISALENRLQILFINNTLGMLIAVTAAYWVWLSDTGAMGVACRRWAQYVSCTGFFPHQYARWRSKLCNTLYVQYADIRGCA